MAVATRLLARSGRPARPSQAPLSRRAALSCRPALARPVPQSGASLAGCVPLPGCATRSGSVCLPGRVRNTSGRVAWPARLLRSRAARPLLAGRTRCLRAVVLIEGRTYHPQQLHEQPLQLTVRGSLVRHTTVVPHNCSSGTVATVTVAPYNSVRASPRVSLVRIGHHMRFAYRIRSAA